MNHATGTDNSDKQGSDQINASVAIERLLEGLQQSAEELSARFLETMPSAYFHDIDPQTQLSHIKALIAAEASGISQVMSLRNQEGTEFTFISDQSFPGQLGKFIRQLPDEKPLQAARVYTASDGSRVLDVFSFGEPPDHNPANPLTQAAIHSVIDRIEAGFPDMDAADLHLHLEGCSTAYLEMTPVEQVVRQFQLAREVRQTGNVSLDLSADPDASQSHLTLSVPRSDNRLVFERVTEFLGKKQIDIQRAYLDSFGGKNPVSVLSFLVQSSGRSFATDSDIWRDIKADLKRLIHLDDEVISLSRDLDDCSLTDAEILLGLGRLAHQRLVKRDALRFARERIYGTLLRYPALALAIAGHFRSRFSPGAEADATALAERINNRVESPDGQMVLMTLLRAADATLRTNFRLEDRSALALRVNPDFFRARGRPDNPYGVFFVIGHEFDGFHVRFRDIARGGVRIVHPAGQEQYALESERHYDECYGLAAAQQLKNKDIPEGGSKGVILARPGADFDQVGLAFADALLDLIIPAPELTTLHPDYLCRDELLYLGPDENVSNDLIVRIINRARLRKHSMPDAFMSSKPGAGINHKQYGVTSEGITVFLEYALKEVGIDPRSQPFTVKMTGGPDGDVAGNEIRLLHREYGDNARIVAIADGSGSLEDPGGLNIKELLRLVAAGLPVSAFSRDCLGSQGSLTSVHEAGGIKHRNGMHNRIVADAFIPAGGRPRTLNNSNWRDYLDGEGVPSSKVIVEGANLFITPKARKQLGKAGVLIIKDSSANKCGVICSSYEIAASMLLDEDGFLQIKDRYIGQVLEKLRQLAATEAESLLKERGRHPGTDLPTLSVILSSVINRASDALAASMDSLRAEYPDLTRAQVKQHLPQVLLDTCGEALYDSIPRMYLHCIMASRLASRIVYCEGLSWFRNRSDREIVELAGQYLREDARVRQLIDSVRKSALPERDEIIHLLDQGGVAAAMKV